MKKIFFCVMLLLSITSALFAMDEDTYVRFTADSIIAAHKLKGNPNAMQMWGAEVRRKYPGLVNQEVRLFEQRLAADSGLKGRVYDRVLENIRSRGYNAHLVGLGGGNTTIEIED